LSSQRSTSAIGDRRAIEDRAAQDKRRAREFVIEVAQTVGLAAALKVPAPPIAGPPAPERPSRFMVGRFFDQFPLPSTGERR
jgi:hypothetical protein